MSIKFSFSTTQRVAGKTSRKFVNVYGAIISIVACRLSDRQYVQVANFGYCVVIIYCAVTIVYRIISLSDFVLPLWRIKMNI